MIPQYHWKNREYKHEHHQHGELYKLFKLMFGAGHELTLQRTDDTDSMIKSSWKNTGGSDEIKPEKVILTKLSWRIPILKLFDKYSLEFLSDIKTKKILSVEFLSRKCESLKLNNNQRNLYWRLSVSTGSERPIYVILGFQKSRFLNDPENSSELITWIFGMLA